MLRFAVALGFVAIAILESERHRLEGLVMFYFVRLEAIR
jgi:hypothetical protein